MPANLLFFAGEFAEIVRCPADEGFAEQILHVIEDSVLVD